MLPSFSSDVVLSWWRVNWFLRKLFDAFLASFLILDLSILLSDMSASIGPLLRCLRSRCVSPEALFCWVFESMKGLELSSITSLDGFLSVRVSLEALLGEWDELLLSASLNDANFWGLVCPGTFWSSLLSSLSTHRVSFKLFLSKAAEPLTKITQN
jgi:polyferredoxin